MSSWPRPETTQPLPPTPPQSRGSERAARLTVTCLAASFTVLVVGLVVFFTVRTLRQQDAEPSPVVGGPAVTTPEDAAKIVGGIGPPPGADVATYVNARKEALAQAIGDRLAVVSLAKYATDAKARAAVGSSQVVALLAAAPGGAPAVVTGDLSSWVSSQTAEARADRDEIQKLLPTVDDAGFKAFYRSEIDRLNKLVSSIKPDGDLVFGLVVRAPAPALQQLATKEEVRLVDVGPTADPGPKPAYRGLRPEETARANDPNTRPA